MRGLKVSTFRCRSGFTLVEMLVVLGLLLVLAVFAVAFVPRMSERENTRRGADRLQGWLLIARQWAKKDQVPTGIRLQLGQTLPNTTTPNQAWVTDLQYIQQPAYYFVQPWSFATSPPNIRRVQVTTGPGGAFNKVVLESPPTPPGVVPCDFSGGYGMTSPMPGVFTPNSPALWPVQLGDYLEVGGGGFVHQISLTTPFTNTNGNYITPPPNTIYDCDTFFLTSGFPNLVPFTSQYRIIRAARIVAGEQGLQLTQDVAIDLNLSRLPANFNPYSPTPLDILFSPTGSVVGNSATTDKLILFVRDVTKTGLQGDLSLLTLNCRTGLIGAQSVDTSTTVPSVTSLVTAPLTFNAGTGQPQITVSSNVTGIIGPNSYVILDAGGANPEVQQVQAVINNGTTIQLQQVNFRHAAPFTVILNPYTFALAPQTSGM